MSEILRQLRRVINEAPEHLLHMRAVVEEAACGTARCAFGWAIIDDWFINNTDINEICKSDWNCPYFPVSIRCSTINLELAELFGISEKDAVNLFATEAPVVVSRNAHDISKQEVLDNIDRLLRGESTVPYKVLEN